MKERGIIFSAPMVRAILDGTKTQTRRIVKFPRWMITDWERDKAAWDFNRGLSVGLFSEGRLYREMRRYADVGDRIWVRETWAVRGNEDGHPVRADYSLCEFEEADRFYCADCKPTNYGMWEMPDGSVFEGWRPSIYMPRWASRITLEVTDVRVQRLQDISVEDAKAEGVSGYVNGHGHVSDAELLVEPGYRHPHFYRRGFEDVWDSIHGDGSWDANPWVWAISFKRIDAARGAA